MHSHPLFLLNTPLGDCGESESALSAKLQNDLTAFLSKRGGRRMKLWELAPSLHCSVIGTCLDTRELRRLLSKCGAGDFSSESDHVVHGEAVLLAAQKGDVARLLHKTLDLRHEAT